MQEKWIRLNIPMNIKSDIIKSWVNKNVRGKYQYKPYDFDSLTGYGRWVIKFEDPSDALAFKLMWLC